MKFLSVMLTCAVAACALFFPSRAEAQISRGEWEFKPVITFTDNVYGLAANLLFDTGIKKAWIPQVEQRFDTQKYLHTGFGHAKVKYWDWGVRNIKAGYRVTYMSKTGPLGVSFAVSYEKRGLQTTMPDDYVSAGGHEKIYFNRQTINPEIMLRLRLGNYISHTYNPLVEIGGSYNFAFACKGLSKNAKSVNDGFRGAIGIGMGNTEKHFSITIRYEYDFYNWFNEKWSPDGGKTHPYEGFKSKIGSLMFRTSFGF